jgi:hypothetical protein
MFSARQFRRALFLDGTLDLESDQRKATMIIPWRALSQ